MYHYINSRKISQQDLAVSSDNFSSISYNLKILLIFLCTLKEKKEVFIIWEQKKSIGKWTLVALAAYELTLAGISLTPVAGKGTSFGEPAMWRNLVLIAAFYLIPLIFYYLHIEGYAVYPWRAVVIFWTIPIPFFYSDIRRAFSYTPGSRGTLLPSMVYLIAMSIAGGKSAASDPLVCKLSGEKKKNVNSHEFNKILIISPFFSDIFIL